MLRKFWRLMKCNVTRTRAIAEVDAVDYYYKSDKYTVKSSSFLVLCATLLEIFTEEGS